MNIITNTIAAIVLASIAAPAPASADINVTPGKRRAVVSRVDVLLDASPVEAVIAKGKSRHILEATIMVSGWNFPSSAGQESVVESELALELADGSEVVFDPGSTANTCPIGESCSLTWTAYLDLDEVEDAFPGLVRGKPLTVRAWPHAHQGSTSRLGSFQLSVGMAKK